MGGCSLLLPCLVSGGGGLVFGYELAVISGALLQLRLDFSLSCVQQEALVSALLVGALLASLLGGSLIDWQGRRRCILLSNALTLAGTALLLGSSLPVLVLGRGVVGFAVCVSSMSCCIFVSELVRPERRGVLVSLYEVGITAGILTAYAVNFLLADTPGGWRWMFGLAAVPTLVQLLALWCLPSETQPNCTHGRPQEDTRAYSCLSLFHAKDNMRTRTLIGLSLVLFQQLTGQPNVLLYASTIFYSLGFHSRTAAVLASLGLGLVKVLSTLLSMALADRVGRRPLLLAGCSVMAVSLITLGLLCTHSHVEEMACVSKGNISVAYKAPVTAVYNETSVNGSSGLETKPPLHSRAANTAVLLSLMAVVGAYSVGFGPLTWLLLTEIFPAEVRGRAFAFTNCFNWSAHLLVTASFLSLVDAVGLSLIFVSYGAVAAAAALFFCKILPETKGKSLEDIDRELRLKQFFQNEDCCSFVSKRKRTPHYEKLHSEDVS